MPANAAGQEIHNQMVARWLILSLIGLVMAAPRIAYGSDDPVLRSSQPLTTSRTLVGYTFPEGQAFGVRLEATDRIPGASGQAKVERHRGTTEIEIELDEMKPAIEFGGDFSTYVLWAVSPERQVENLGEFVLSGNRSKLNVTTRLQAFGMVVTAEPHLMVRRPSMFVVLEATGLTARNASTHLIRPSVIEYRGNEGVYDYALETLEQRPEARGEVRTEVKQARMAVLLAERAGAETFASEELNDARLKLLTVFEAAEIGRSQRTITTLAHDAIRMGLQAQELSEERAFQASLDTERQGFANEIRNAQSEAANQAGRASEAEQRASLSESERQAALAELQQALSKIAETRSVAHGLIVSLPGILFDFDRDQLRPEAREVLSRMCGVLALTPGFKLEIEGHTDGIGTDEYNQTLSERRAQNVHSYIEGCGLRDTTMRWRGYGKAYPVTTNDNAEGRQRNRRVEIVVLDAS